MRSLPLLDLLESKREQRECISFLKKLVLKNVAKDILFQYCAQKEWHGMRFVSTFDLLRACFLFKHQSVFKRLGM